MCRKVKLLLLVTLAAAAIIAAALAGSIWALDGAEQVGTLALAILGLVANAGMMLAAILGVSMWQKQLQGEREHTLAVNALTTAYNMERAVRESLNTACEFIRHPSELEAQCPPTYMDERLLKVRTSFAKATVEELRIHLSEWTRISMMGRVQYGTDSPTYELMTSFYEHCESWRRTLDEEIDFYERGSVWVHGWDPDGKRWDIPDEKNQTRGKVILYHRTTNQLLASIEKWAIPLVRRE